MKMRYLITILVVNIVFINYVNSMKRTLSCPMDELLKLKVRNYVNRYNSIFDLCLKTFESNFDEHIENILQDLNLSHISYKNRIKYAFYIKELLKIFRKDRFLYLKSKIKIQESFIQNLLNKKIVNYLNNKKKLNKIIELIEWGANINAKDFNGRNLLMLFAQYGYIDIVELLIERGADFKSRDNKGNTALMYAARMGHRGIIKFFLDKGDDINIKNSNNLNALIFAIYGNHIKAFKFLLMHGADVNVATNSGGIPLMLAIQNGNSLIVKLLLSKIKDIDIQDAYGQTALILAVDKGNIDIVKLLIDYGANVNIKTKSGVSPLMLSIEKGYIDIAKLLILTQTRSQSR